VRFAALAFLVLLCAAPAAAQIRPQAGTGDPHLQTVRYAEGQVVLLELAPGYQMTLELSPDEQVENVAVGDSGAWQVTANRRGDRLFIKSVQSGVSTNMTVITNARLYAMELSPLSGPAQAMAYVVRFTYPEPEKPAEEIGVTGNYRLTGDKALRPSRISDDGEHTYIEWPKERPLPAVYAADEKGEERLVNGMMREDGLFVIDSIAPRLVFRIDKQVAGAKRVVPKAKR
jgi:type IV secretion system protein VirB9